MARPETERESKGDVDCSPRYLPLAPDMLIIPH